MKVKELVEQLDYEIITSGDLEAEITGCYVGDLLSWVMGRASLGNLWITIMSNVNVIAVAALTEVSAVILAEDVNLDNNALEKAKEQGICVLKTKESAYDAAVSINNCISRML